MNLELVPYEAEERLDWIGLTEALKAGHSLPRAEIGDTFLYRGDDTVLSRAAWIDGLGIAVKTATIFPRNSARGMPAVNGGVSLYDDATGELAALVDFHLVTKWKTAGDSLLAARLLARPESAQVLIVGAGSVARSLREAYGAAFPDARFAVWNRTPEKARDLARQWPETQAVDALEPAVRKADIVTVATMSSEPVIRGEWLSPGTHLDLIGAYRPDMREADDAALKRARLFMDSRDTVLDHIGEFRTPLAEGLISREDVVADFYDIPTGRFSRVSADEITLFKNGGGAHLDLMTARYILDRWRGA